MTTKGGKDFVVSAAAHARALRAKQAAKKQDAPLPKENPYSRLRRKLDEDKAARTPSEPSGKG